MNNALKTFAGLLGLCAIWVLLIAGLGLAIRVSWAIFMLGWGLV